MAFETDSCMSRIHKTADIEKPGRKISWENTLLCGLMFKRYNDLLMDRPILGNISRYHLFCLECIRNIFMDTCYAAITFLLRFRCVFGTREKQFRTHGWKMVGCRNISTCRLLVIMMSTKRSASCVVLRKKQYYGERIPFRNVLLILIDATVFRAQRITKF